MAVRERASARVLVLCCARDSRHLLAPALELLAARNFDVQVVSGVDRREETLLERAKQYADGIFVLFEGDDLPRSTIDRLRQRLAQAGIPVNHIAIMPLDWRQPLEVVERIQKIERASPSPSVRRSTVVAAPPEPPALRSRTVPATPPPPAPTRTAAPAVPPAPTAGPPPAPMTPQTDRSPIVAASMPVHTPESASADDLSATLVGHSSRTKIGLVAVGALAMIFAIGMLVTGDDEPETPSEPVTIVSAEPVTPASAAPAEAVKKVDEPKDEPKPAADAKEPVVAVPANTPAATPTPAPSGTLATISGAPTIAPTAETITPLPPAELPTPDIGPEDAATAPKAGGPPAVPEEIATEEVAIDDTEIESIYAGLVARKFRALDILLIAPEPRKIKGKRVYKTPRKLNWAQAGAYCEALQIAGVSGWRLPTVGELGSITRGELLPEGRFWSSTTADTFGAARVVWNSDNKRMGGAPAGWKGGRVICVRTLAKPVEDEAK